MIVKFAIIKTESEKSIEWKRVSRGQPVIAGCWHSSRNDSLGSGRWFRNGRWFPRSSDDANGFITPAYFVHYIVVHFIDYCFDECTVDCYDTSRNVCNNISLYVCENNNSQPSLAEAGDNDNCFVAAELSLSLSLLEWIYIQISYFKNSHLWFKTHWLP